MPADTVTPTLQLVPTYTPTAVSRPTIPPALFESGAGQGVTDAVIEAKETFGDGRSYHLLRHGATVTAKLTFPNTRSDRLFEIPAGYRPMTEVRRELRGYTASPGGGDRIRTGLTHYIYVYSGGTVVDAGGFVETSAGEILSDALQQVTLEWVTATEETEGSFDTPDEHHDGTWALAKGGIHVFGLISASRSPVPPTVRTQPAVLFTLPESFRPAVEVTAAAWGRAVDVLGQPTDPVGSVSLRLTVAPDGTVRYLADAALADVEYLAFDQGISWETAVSPDRIVLERIHQAIAQDPGDAVRLNWGRADVPLHQWSGVSTDAFGRVTHLKLAGKRLDGHIPADISELRALRFLHLGTKYDDYPNRLTLDADALCRLTNLEDLDLSLQPVEGQLPACWSQLKNLVSLILFHTHFTGPLPPEWAALTQLEVLDLRSVLVSGILPPAWQGMASLERLQLDNPLLEGSLPAAWSEMASLRVIEIVGTPVRGPLPASWAEMPRLEFLALPHTAINEGIPPAWARMASSTVIEIDGESIDIAALR